MLLSYWCLRGACSKCETPECQHSHHREDRNEPPADRPGRRPDRRDWVRGRERPGPGDGMALLRPGGGPAATRAEPAHHTGRIPHPRPATPPPAPPQPTRDRGPGQRPAGDPRRSAARPGPAVRDLHRDPDADADAQRAAVDPWLAHLAAAARHFAPRPDPHVNWRGLGAWISTRY